MTPEPGWYPDPYFLKRERYWDDGWTDQFRVVEEEHPAVEPPDAVAAEAAPSTPSSGDVGAAGAGGATVSWGRHGAGEPPTASYPRVHDDDTGVVAATPDAAPTGPTPVVHADDTLAVPIATRQDDTGTTPRQRAEDDTLVVPATPGGDAPSDSAPSAYNILVGPQQFLEWDQSRAAQEEAAAVRGRGRHRSFVIGALALVVVAIVVVVAVVATTGGGGGGGHPTTAAAAAHGVSATVVTGVSSATAAPSVQTAAHRSVAKKAAVVTITLAPASSTSSTTSHIASGSGAFVLANGLGQLSVSWPGATPEVQNFVFDRAFLYYSVTTSPVPGKSWVVTSTNNPPALGPSGQLGDTISLMGNPGVLLGELTSTPLTVTSLGSSSIGGVSVQRYQVSIMSSPTVSSPAGYGSHNSEEVDVGPDHLVRQIVMTGPVVTVNGQQVQQNIVVAFSHYGKPTVVATPPASEVLPISQDIVRPSPSLTAGNSGNS